VGQLRHSYGGGDLAMRAARAIGIQGFGDAPRLTELPVPEPGGGQVQVTIEVTATNPLDGAIASGALATRSARSAASPDTRTPAPLTSRN
jgi:NADPH:quinone reductase-like Zn-dependent oxidoreductase